MAAPSGKTLKDLNGQWVLNKTYSDDTDSILAMQGIGWLTRKAISMATITLHVKEYIADENKTHVDIVQTLTGGIKGTTELRTLDWTPRDHTDRIFGDLWGKTRFIPLSSLKAGDGTVESDLDFLTKGWEGGMDDEHVQSYVESKAANNKWTANQVWGFEKKDFGGGGGKEERRYVRHVVVRKGEEEWKQARLVYDWHGEEAVAEGEGEGEDGLAYGG